MKKKDKARLIALVDFSTYTEALTALAIRWCNAARGDLILVHRVPGMVPGMASSSQRTKLIDAEKKMALEKLEALTADQLIAGEVRYEVTDENLVEFLTRVADEGHNDIIVVGMKGSGRWKSMLMGSVTTHVIDEMDEMIITVPETRAPELAAAHRLPRRIVVAHSDRFALNEEGLTIFLETFQDAVEAIHFVCVAKTDEEAASASRTLADLAARYATRARTSHEVFRGDNAFEEIRAHIHRDPDTVLVTQKGSRALLDRFFRRFFITRVIEDASIPMVVLPWDDAQER